MKTYICNIDLYEYGVEIPRKKTERIFRSFRNVVSTGIEF